MLILRKEWRPQDRYFDLILMELLVSDVTINLSSLIIKHMRCVLTQDKNWHTLPYGFWLF